jgi:hypothetical protein
MTEPANHGNMESPAFFAAAVTPGASPLANASRGLYVGETGNVAVTMAGGGDVTFSGVPAGMILPIRVTHVLGATTATNIIALR